MITCKEDLINTYIENDHGELRDLYLDKMKELGIRSCGDSEFNYLRNSNIIICSTQFHKEGQAEHDSEYNGDYRRKQLTLSDLKPTKQSTAIDTLERMGYEWHGGEWTKKKPVEYEYIKVTDGIFDLKDEFERGELYSKFQCARDYSKIVGTQTLSQALNQGCCYRRTEKQVDWRDEVHAKLQSDYHWSTPIAEVIDDESDCFLELCRTALRARGEL